MRRAYERSLLCGVSLLALSVASGAVHARSLGSAFSAVAPTQAAQDAAIQAAQQAAGAAAQAQLSLSRAAAALAAARKLQSDAAAAAQAAAASSSVPDGLKTGGLVPTGGTDSDPLAGIKAGLLNGDTSKWTGATAPVQTTNGSKVQVDITQTQPKSILYWNSFNVGANTTVNFDQQASNWVVLNRVDNSTAPSRVLGQISAIGGVYLINGNGIIFGAGSQVNVHTLVASSLDVGPLGSDLPTRDAFFKNIGVGNPDAFSIYDGSAPTSKTTNKVAGDIIVDRGASITGNIQSDQVSLGSPGSVYLFGGNVHNSGSITVNGGEVAMIAARTIDFVPNGYSAFPSNVLGKDDNGNSVPFTGTEFRISQFSTSYDANGYGKSNRYLTGTGAVTHDGLIDASRGIVVMNGDAITVDNPRDASGHNLTDSAGNLIQGVISVDTSVDRNSFVLLRAATSVTMNGVISSQPVDDGAKGLTSAQSFTPAYIEMTAQNSVTMGSTGLISAPAAQVSLNATNILALNVASGQNLFNQGNNGNVLPNSQSAQTVLLAPGATIDVSGLQNVELPASYNYVSFQPRGEFADMPLQRPPFVILNADGTGPVYGQTLWIDIRASGTRADGTTWVGTPLADASGVVAAVPRSIYQLMTVGGSISLNTDLTNNNGASNVHTDGSVMNVAGGSVKFLPGMVNTTRLLGADGRIYSMANADPNITYLGIAGQFTLNHAHWGIKEIWSTDGQMFSPGYTEGHDAGTVNVVTVDPSLLGTIFFGSTPGERQKSSGNLPLQGTLALTTPSSVQIGATASANYTAQSSYTTNLSADILSKYGLSSLSVTSNDFTLSSASTLNLAAGGSFSVTAAAIDIAGSIAAHGGSVNLLTDQQKLGDSSGAFGANAGQLFKAPTNASGGIMAANVFVEGTIDVSGRFVNDIGLPASQITGPAFINGGTISITTDKSSVGIGVAFRDTTGSILLASGSLLDVSGGGYVSRQGNEKFASTNLLAGKAGGISLATYAGKVWTNPGDSGGPHQPTPGLGNSIAIIELDGNLRGYGFESNGSLRIAAADTIRIGGTLQAGETSGLRVGGVASTLPLSLLTGGGFGSYTIESVKDAWSSATSNIIVSAGTGLTLQQQNLNSLLDYTAMPTGTMLGQPAAPALAILPNNQRKAVDLALKADNILFDTGSTLITDPKANITLAAVIDDRSTLKPTDPAWTVPAQSVKLQGTIVDHGGNIFINALATHLSSQAKVDLSGTFIDNSLFGTRKGPATSGSYISGGTFTVEAGQYDQGSKNYLAPVSSSYLVADPGALVDVSGAAGNVQFVTGSHSTASQWSWSDAGSVSVDVSGFAWGGSFAAAGGRYLAADGSMQSDPRANGGTILIGGGNMSLRQDMTDVANALALYNSGVAPTSLNVAADQLAPFDNVYLWAGNAVGGASLVFTDLPSTNYNITGKGAVGGVSASAFGWNVLSISGALDWTVANRLHIAAGIIQAPTSSPVDANISAQYVVLSGSGRSPLTGSSTLTVSAQTIDLEGAPTPATFKSGDIRPGLDFSGFSQINLNATGDIRLGTLKVMDGLKNNIADGAATAEQSSFTGNLITAANVNMTAGRIYPETAVTFTIETPGNVTFSASANGNTEIPLSAGGGITVYAKNITQAGNLFAPLGIITLGNTDSSVSSVITQNVELAPGSLTSVTLADTTVPYGATTDNGNNWYYNANLNSLTAPPTKGLVLAGNDVKRDDSSTIDLRGGGDLQAMEWIQGKGGSRDTLTTTPLGQTVYALVPVNDPVAAYDIHFATTRSANNGVTITPGDTIPLAGQQITLDGGGGIAAGTYTLYPARYATLPGAMRVVVYSSDNTGKNIPTGSKLPDGTVLVTGNFTQSTVAGRQSSGQTVFAVQTSSVWPLYSEYQLSTANSFFRQYATKHNLPVPPTLPMDAGRLSIFGLESIVLNGTALAQPGQDSDGNIGRGGELDISAPQLAVVGHAEYVAGDIPTGYVGVDVSQINSFESVLIGGRRTNFGTDTSAGTLITPTASNVIVDTRGETFSAPEILMVAQVGQWQELKQVVTVGSSSVLFDLPVFTPVAGSGSVTVRSGSIIETQGAVHTGFGRNYIVVSDGQPAVTAQSLATLLGGTLSASGTEITGVDLTKLPASWFNGSTGSPTLVVNNTAIQQALAYYANGGPVQPGRGALFAASNDPTLQLTGPSKTGASSPTLTIKFQDVAAAPAGSLGTGPVSGSLTLPGGDTGNAGRVVVEDGARISTNTLTLQGTASSNVIAVNTTDLHANLVNLIAPSIGIGAGSTVTGISLALPANSAQFVDVQTLALRALNGPITVYGDFNSGAQNLVLDANALALGLDGGVAHDATITASDTITLTNITGPAYSGGSVANPNSLNLIAREIDLGNGVVNGTAPAAFMTIAGYASVNMTASDRVLVKGPGTLTLGVSDVDKVDLTVTTPSVLVAGATGINSQGFNITGYAGNVTVQDTVARNGAVDRPADSTEVGGSLQISASNITIASTIQAQGGTITLNAVAGDIELKPGAYLSAAGYQKRLVDLYTFAPGGKIVLSADNRGTQNLPPVQGGGDVILDAGSVVDVAQVPGGFGYGGEIDVSALAGRASIAGTLLGAGGPGLGGRFKLDVLGAADLTALADNLLAGGITGSIDIHTRTGNLELLANHTLKANSITLTADDTAWDSTNVSKQFGQVIIAGTVNADGYAGNTPDGTGQAGGQIGLFGRNAVVLQPTGQILARSPHLDERGGDVMIGTAWSAAGNIDLQAGSIIDVSGGIAGGLSGGTVTLRAPLNGNNDVKIAGLDSTILGARAVNIQAFLTINTVASPNNVNGIDGSQLTTKGGAKAVWDGYVDPAGAVTSNGIAPDFGTWTNVTGDPLQVTPGTYTAPPTIAVVTGAGQTIGGTTFVDPQTGATFYQVTDPVTGTTFRSSLQVTSVNVTNGGSYSTVPTVSFSAANGTKQPSWGVAPSAKVTMYFNDFDATALIAASGKDVSQLNGKGVILNYVDPVTGKITNLSTTGTLKLTFNTDGTISNATIVGGLVADSSKLPNSIHIKGQFFFSPGVDLITTNTLTTMKVHDVAVSGAAGLTGGAGYSGAVNVAFSSDPMTGAVAATATTTMGAALTVTSVSKGYQSVANLPTITFGGSGGAAVSYGSQTTGLVGLTDENHDFAPNVGSLFIPLASSKVFNGAGDAAALTSVSPYQPHILLYSDVLANFVEGNGIQGVGLTGSYQFTGLLDRLKNGLVQQLGADVVHVQPGIELVNTSTTNNSGNITVASNWNLAAGKAGNLNADGTFNPNSSYVNFNYRLANSWGGLDAGALTLRAAGNINVNASISDGFFQFANYFDPGYQAQLATYLGAAGVANRWIDKSGGAYAYYLNNILSLGVPVAPYSDASNGISPTSLSLVSADLFPHALRVCLQNCSSATPVIGTVIAPSSWSYNFTAGAEVSSANPNARVPLALGTGDVVVDKHGSYTQTLVQDDTGHSGPTSATVNIPTMIRTGTGNITISAARDVIMQDTVAPGVIYAAGVNTQQLADPGYTSQAVNGVSSLVAANPDGFFEPRLLAYGNNAALKGAPDLYYGPPTAAAFPEAGGDVVIDAQRDIKGNITSGNKVPQYYQPWLLSDSDLTAGVNVSTMGAGVFAPSGTQIASQSAWWIQYGSFQQGFLSAGGNVSVIAGHDLVDVSVSLPTTGRVSGGLSANSTPVTHLYGSGNMVVRAGGDILGGSFYEGSGHAVIAAGGEIGQNGTVSRYAASALTLPDVPLLAVDTGLITMTAAGAITMAGVVNPAELHAQQASSANSLDFGTNNLTPLYMDTYGQNSNVQLLARSGDVTINLAPPTIGTFAVPAAASTYPASFGAAALQGDLITTGIGAIAKVAGISIPTPGIVLSPSEEGTFDLLAEGSIDLTFGYPVNPTTALASLQNIPRPIISAGPSLIDAAFDPFRPNSGHDEASSRAILAHQDDLPGELDTTARIYAATGDITATGTYGLRTSGDTRKVYQHIEINRPTKIYAGRDIVDLNIIVQNIHANDVSTIEAGRNITYTGYSNGGGIQVAGPGHLLVLAGGDIGPFLPAAFDNATSAPVQEGIVSVGNSSPTPVGNAYFSNTGGGGSIGIYNQALLGPINNQRRNTALTDAAQTKEGASIDILFGVKFGVDYGAMIAKYYDPASPDYLGPAVTINLVDHSTTPLTLQQFLSEPVDLVRVVVDERFFAYLKQVAILKAAGDASATRLGYEMINTMFPASWGYTQNALGGGSNGAATPVKTGDMNLLHATVQTKLGGDISIFGPGGTLTVGSLAAEPNTALKLRDIGILTLGGGAINTFTDGSVLVNSSRVLTTQGGDITMWSSNGDLDAGRGSKTTLSAPALQVLYDQDDYQSVDLGGFVTGAGIGTLQASSVAAKANLYLLAPRGKIDFGTAGTRASGNAVFVAPVIANSSNNSVQGTTTGIPTISVPNVGALAAGSNTAGAAAKTAEQPTAAGASKPASIFIVEVIGYGGGDGQGQDAPASDSNSSSSDGKQQ